MPGAGLCDHCLHQRLVRNTRGSAFSLCERSKTDPSFPKYPRLPVLECRGFEDDLGLTKDESGSGDIDEGRGSSR